MTYRLIWGTQQEVAWASMVVPQTEGGMGVQDFTQIQTAALVKKSCRAWDGVGVRATGV